MARTKSVVEAPANGKATSKKELKASPAPVKKTKKVAEGESIVSQREGKGGGKRFFIHSHPVTSVIRWMGKKKWTFENARHVLNELGLTDVADGTIRTQISSGKRADAESPIISLTRVQAETLNTLLPAAAK